MLTESNVTMLGLHGENLADPAANIPGHPLQTRGAGGTSTHC